jgi:O-antigen ligase
VPPTETRVVWTFVFVAFLCYMFAVTTFKLPIGEASMIAGLLGLALQRERMRFPAVLGWSAVFLGWCVLGYFRSPFPTVVWANVILFAKLCLIMLVAANALRSPGQVRFFMIFFLACYALFPVRGAIFNYFANYTLFGRALWNYTYDNPNDLAALTLLLLSIAAALLATERTPWIRWCAKAGLAVLPLLILMTQSRGGFVALCVFAAVAVFTHHHRRRLQTAVIVAALGLAVVAVAPSGVWTRVRGLAQVTGDLDKVDPEGSAKSRYEIWGVATQIIGDYPWTGVGWGAYPLAHEPYAALSHVDPSARGARDTHSTYLNVLAETGYLGLLLFLGILWSVVHLAERARRLCRLVRPQLALQLMYLELGLLAFLVAGVFGSFAKLSFLYIQLVLLWAVTQNALHVLPSRRSVVLREPTRVA